MNDEPENHTLRLLQEMRNENRQFRGNMQDFHAEMRDFRREVGERLDRIESVFAGLSFLHADERGEIEAMKTRLDRIEKRLDLPDAPAE